MYAAMSDIFLRVCGWFILWELLHITPQCLKLRPDPESNLSDWARGGCLNQPSSTHTSGTPNGKLRLRRIQARGECLNQQINHTQSSASFPVNYKRCLTWNSYIFYRCSWYQDYQVLLSIFMDLMDYTPSPVVMRFHTE